jgi:TolB-like protein
MTSILFLVPSGNQVTSGKRDHAQWTPQEAQAELSRILSSALFCKAPRACALLRFVVLQLLEGAAGSANEYAIGIEVFGRKAALYSTGDDPIVRVQAGRLRRKLTAYYANEGRHNPLRIRIPVGTYMPCIEHAAGMAATARLTFQPLACLSQEWPAQSFTLGLNEELGFRLHREFGEQAGGIALLPGTQALSSTPEVNYLLEGSVRQDGERIRTSLRLIDRVRSGIAWSEQLDHGFDLPLARQEQLADACCSIVRRHMGMR